MADNWHSTLYVGEPVLRRCANINDSIIDDIERLHVTSSTYQIPEIRFYSLEKFFKHL